MNHSLIDQISRAILYEGYILYPYRPSLKNQQRWMSGGLLPQEFVETHSTGDLAVMQCQFLITGHRPTLDVKVRFLHLVHRQVARLDPITSINGSSVEPPVMPVDSLEVAGRQYLTWQEAVEREVRLASLAVNSLNSEGHRQSFSFRESRHIELLNTQDGTPAGALVRTQQALLGEVELTAERLDADLHRVELRICNCSRVLNPAGASRESALFSALVSTHAMMYVSDGNFVSLLEMPAQWAAQAAECRQVGLWPILVGQPGETDCMLAPPIIVYDYPQVAMESPGDLFDGLEIDEILTLRIMTLTDDEKRAMAAVDAETSSMLRRTDSLAPAELMSLHGAIRGRR
jgi:hydrogenase maturation protease